MISKKEIQNYQDKNERFESGINKETGSALNRFKLELIDELQKDNPSEPKISQIFDSLNKDVQAILLNNSDELRRNIVDFFSLQMTELKLFGLVNNVTYQDYAFVNSLINRMFTSRLTSLDMQKIIFINSMKTFQFQNVDSKEIERKMMIGEENSFVSPYQKVLNSLTLELTDKIYKTINASLTECYVRTNEILSGGQNG